MTGADNPLRLVVDTSVLVAELLRARGRARLSHPTLKLFIPEETWGEVRHELSRRVRYVMLRIGPEPDAGAALLTRCLSAVEVNVTIVLAATYTPLEATARRRIPRDPRDWPTVALALALDAGIWTEDGDFLGRGLPTWTTTTLIRHLDEDARP